MSDLTEREQTENTLRAAKEEAARQVRELPAYEVFGEQMGGGTEFRSCHLPPQKERSQTILTVQ